MHMGRTCVQGPSVSTHGPTQWSGMQNGKSKDTGARRCGFNVGTEAHNRARNPNNAPSAGNACTHTCAQSQALNLRSF